MILHRVLFNETLFTTGISQLFLTTCTHPRLSTLIKTLNSNITSEMKEKPNMPKGLIDFQSMAFYSPYEVYLFSLFAGALIETPMFDGHSFMSFPGIEGALQQLKLVIRFMIHKSGNMLLLYNGQRQFPQRGDFISLAIIGKVEFRFDLGSGPGIVRSARNITVGQWHTVHVERTLDEGSLTLDNDPPVTDDSPCCTKG